MPKRQELKRKMPGEKAKEYDAKHHNDPEENESIFLGRTCIKLTKMYLFIPGAPERNIAC